MKQRRALALFSGGLDSILAVKVIQQQGIDVLALNFTSPFFGCSPLEDGEPLAVQYARRYNIPIRVIPLGDQYLEMLRKPRHGYGSALNPCIDCKTFMLCRAKELMPELEADFIITGEVLGQRPMSQRRDTLRIIERDSGLTGLLLRPLSARFMVETVPEAEGWVDRKQLPAMKGRGRKEQIRLAEQLGVDLYPAPGGGCLLTEDSYVPKVQDLLNHLQQPEVRDFELLRAGRHFRLSDGCKAVVGRNHEDNEKIKSAIADDETTIFWPGGGSPLVLLVGQPEQDDVILAAQILLRYTRAPKGEQVQVTVRQGVEETGLMALNNISEEELEQLRI